MARINKMLKSCWLRPREQVEALALVPTGTPTGAGSR
jgi:hypothetical protein